ncbi:MAG: Bax inhibitor-1/YccA family membrane protein, partial [Bacteroidota bacterium]
MMNIRRSANPVLTEKVFTSARDRTYTETMTIRGTVNKIFLMLLLVVLGAGYTWKFMGTGNISAMQTYMLIGGIGGFITALITVFKMTWSPITAPIYAVLQGLFLGGISAYFNAQFPGIVVNAVALTFGTLFALLAVYRSGIIKVTDNFRLGVVAATGGIAIAYFLSFILGLF